MNEVEKELQMPTLVALEQRLDDMNSDMREMRSSMTKIADAISRLAVLDEKAFINSHNIEKVSNRLERIETRISETEIRHVKFEAESEAAGKVKKFLWATFGGSLVIAGVEVVKMLVGK